MSQQKMTEMFQRKKNRLYPTYFWQNCRRIHTSNEKFSQHETYI